MANKQSVEERFDAMEGKLESLEAENKELKRLAAIKGGDPEKYIMSTKEEVVVARRIAESEKRKAEIGVELPAVGSVWQKIKNGKTEYLISKAGTLTKVPRKLTVTSVDDPSTMRTAGEMRPKEPTIWYKINIWAQIGKDEEKEWAEKWAEKTSSSSLSDWKLMLESGWKPYVGGE